MTGKTPEFKNIYDAIRYVQNEAPIIGKEKNNPFFKSKYADLPTIWKAIKDLMDEAGLCVVTTTNFDEHGNEFIITEINGYDNAIASRTHVMIGKRTAQEYGSFLTYIRRYHLSAMLGLQVDDDDDGNLASKIEPKPVNKPKPATEDEVKMVIRDMDAAETFEQLEEIKATKVKGIWPRCNTTQRQNITNIGKIRQQELINENNEVQ